MKKEKLLVSACLLGEKTRYDGKDNYLPSLALLAPYFEFVSFCPEVAGGLGIPRSPCERVGSKVINLDKQDKTNEFILGANQAVELCTKLGIAYALLQDRSPSCGVASIYDGSFKGILIKGEGLTTKALKEKGVEVYSDQQLDTLLAKIKQR